MGIHTDIEWADSTLNLQMGCDGCELWNGKDNRRCYAGVLTERYGGVNTGFPESFDKPLLFLDRLRAALRWSDLAGTARPGKPWLNRMPRMIFLDDMGDTFTESLPQDWLAPVVPALAASKHTYLLLTKRGSRMRRFFAGQRVPDNIWPGVSLTSQATMPRAKELVRIDAQVPWLSIEPLLGPIVIPDSILYNIKWAIVGGESGPGAVPMNIEWMISVVKQLVAAKVHAFVKQLGDAPGVHQDDIGKYVGVSFHHFDKDSNLFVKSVAPKGKVLSEWPEELRIREVPRALYFNSLGG